MTQEKNEIAKSLLLAHHFFLSRSHSWGPLLGARGQAGTQCTQDDIKQKKRLTCEKLNHWKTNAPSQFVHSHAGGLFQYSAFKFITVGKYHMTTLQSETGRLKKNAIWVTFVWSNTQICAKTRFKTSGYQGDIRHVTVNPPLACRGTFTGANRHRQNREFTVFIVEVNCKEKKKKIRQITNGNEPPSGKSQTLSPAVECPEQMHSGKSLAHKNNNQQNSYLVIQSHYCTWKSKFLHQWMALWGWIQKAMPRASMVMGEKDRGGGLETREIGWCRLGGRGGRADRRDTMKCCAVSGCDCQLKREEHTHTMKWQWFRQQHTENRSSYTHPVDIFPTLQPKDLVLPKKANLYIFVLHCMSRLNQWVFVQCDPAVCSNTVRWSGKHSWEDATELEQVPGTVSNMHGPTISTLLNKEAF